MLRNMKSSVIALLLGVMAFPAFAALAPPPSSNAAERIWIASPSHEYAISLPASDWVVKSVETWDHDISYKIVEKLDFMHVGGAMLWVDVWKNPFGLDLDTWMIENEQVLTFSAPVAERITTTSQHIPAYRYTTSVSIQSYKMVLTLFEYGGKVYQVSHLERGSANTSPDYNEVINGMEFVPSPSWQDASVLQQQAASLSSADNPHILVAACGGEQDTCPCGASNPFPCCNYGNCTWYAWHRACCDWGKNAPPRGNARDWAPVFSSHPDYEVSSTPTVGSVACNNTSGCNVDSTGICYGHVAFVTGVSGDTITVMEQGCESFSTRTRTYNKSWFNQGYARPKPVSGNLTVTINPADARSAGAQWRRTGTTTWRNSGYTETGLSPGSKTVEFKDVTNWDKPANANVTVNAGQTASLTRDYVRHVGSLTVTINPADARTAGAQWRRTGTTTWRNSGTTEGSIPTGSYTVEFSALASPWIKPTNISVSITKNATTSPSVRYNRPPVLAAPGSHFVHVGSLLEFSLSATDADGDAITYSMANAPSGATLASGTFRFTPSSGQAGGTFSPSFTVTDALGATNTKSASIQVGTPPVIQPVAPQRARVGVLHTFDVYANEPNSDTITLSISNAPSGSSFNPGDGRHGTFSFTPSVAQGGQVHSIVFTASDADGSHTITVPLIVGAPPTLEPLEDVAITAGQTATFTVVASDPNNDAKTFNMNGAPATATLTGSGNTRTFSYTGLETDKGLTFEITFHVSEIDGEDTTTMNLRVQGPPEFVEIPPQRVVVGNLLELPVSAIDPDGDAMEFSVSNAPASAVFTPHASGGVLAYTPTEEEGALTYTARFYSVAVDGVSSIEVPITVGVLPTITVPGSQKVAKYNTLAFEVSATDVNPDDVLSLSASPLPPNATFESDGSTGTFRITPASFQGNQNYTVNFIAADGIDGVDEKSVSIQVLDDDMYEQNDAVENAASFDPYRGLVRTARQSDDDWYAVTLPLGRQRVLVTVQFVREQGDMSIFLYNAQGTLVGQSTATVSGASLDVYSPFFGPHYLLVRGDNQANGYALAWDHADSWNGCVGADDPYSPNHTRETAAPLAAGLWLSEQLGVGTAGAPDWFAVDVPAGEEFLSVTILYGQWEHPLRLEVYDPDGELVGTANGSDGLVAWSSSLLAHGLHTLKVVSINEPACIPYNVIAAAAPRENLPVEYLTGKYLRLPVETVSGRWLAPNPSEGVRYNAQGTGGHQGVDVWGGVPALVNHVIGKGGNNILTNGLGWFAAPVITRLSEGTWNRLAIEGQPFNGLKFHRELSFEDGDQVVVVRDRLINQSASAYTSLITMDSVNPTPDYAQSELRTSNDVTSGETELVTASSIHTGLTVGLGSTHPSSVADASFLSRLNPYTVASSPGDPNNAVANLSIKLVLNHGNLSPGQTNEVLWYLIFGENTSEAADQFEIAVLRNERDDDAFEPNNNSSSATDLSAQAGSWIRAIQANDDWYAIGLPIGVQDLNVHLRFASAHGNMSVSLRTEDGQEICSSLPTSWGASLACVAPAHGMVYLKVEGDNAGNVYDLQWNAASSWGGCGSVSDDSFEPNDTLGQAASLQPGLGAALQTGSMLVAGDDDWYELEITPEHQSLTVTCSHYSAHGDLSLELYDHAGELLTSVNAGSDKEVLSFTVPSEGRYYLRVVPPATATCNLYDLYWSGISVPSASDTIYLHGYYLYLPIRVTEEPGRFLAPGAFAGLRYDPSGTSGMRGIDLWRQLTLPAAHYIAWGGNRVVTNGKNWASGPLVEKLSHGSLNRARIIGYPKEGLRFERNIRFNDNDLVITVEDVFVNEGEGLVTQLLTMDAFNPNPDFDQGVINKRNYVTAVYDRTEVSLAEALQCGITLALGSVSPYLVLDASFISRQNPYTVLSTPNHPVGQEANYSLKLLLDYGTLAPSVSVTGVWQIVAGRSRADALTRWQSSSSNQIGLMDANASGLPDWWEVAHFNGIADPLADPDADGTNNREEYLAGTNPNDPSSVFQVYIHKESGNPVLPLVRWEVLSGRKATLLQGTNLFGPFWPVSGAPQNPGLHSITDRLDQSQGAVFYFLRLDEPNE